MAQVVTGYSQSKAFQIGTSTTFLVVYLFLDGTKKSTIRYSNGLPIDWEMKENEESVDFMTALTAAQTWALSILNE